MSNIEKPNWLVTANQFRFNPLTGEKVQVSTERLLRAWGGEVSAHSVEKIAEYLPNCPFCPGSIRKSGEKAPAELSEHPYAFTNDTAALKPPAEGDAQASYSDDTGIYQAETAYGACEVIVHHPRHDLTLATVEREHAVKVFRLWANRYKELGERLYINYVNIFENFLFGSSIRHPHNQLWASSLVSPIQEKILSNIAAYKEKTGKHLIQTIAEKELKQQERVVFENEDFVAVVPFWAVWPFEMIILPRKPKNSLLDLNEFELLNFTNAYITAIEKLNALFGGDCPYSSGLCQAPTDGGDYDGVMYLMFRPPVLRDIRTMKWMVGYELMSMSQRDLTPEAAAFLLRNPDGWEEFKMKFIHNA
tara:strand:+ start:3421 stop:4506 length:1086 start_codon:yes stop_codon:yes gene_type:complete